MISVCVDCLQHSLVTEGCILNSFEQLEVGEEMGNEASWLCKDDRKKVVHGSDDFLTVPFKQILFYLSQTDHHCGPILSTPNS